MDGPLQKMLIKFTKLHQNFTERLLAHHDNVAESYLSIRF